MIEVAESVKKQTHREKVEILNRTRTELKVAKSKMHSREVSICEDFSFAGILALTFSQ